MTEKIYNYEPLYKRLIKRVKDENLFDQKEKKLIFDFDISLGKDRTSYARRCDLLYKLIIVKKEYFKKTLYQSTNQKDIESICERMNNDDHIKESSRSSYKAILKQFYRWYNKGILPEYVAWIRRKKLRDKRLVEEKTKNDILTEVEIKKLLNVITSIRDQALFRVALETGMRPNEILRLKRKHIDFKNKDLCLITVPSDTKTGSRNVPISTSVKSLLKYMEEWHPLKDEEAPLWVQDRRNREHPLKYGGYEFLIHKYKKLTGIKKRFHPYIFRFTSYTLKAKAGWSEQWLKAYHGLDPSSKMLGTYVKMIAEDLSNEILELSGKKVIKRKERKASFTLCPRCEEENEIDRKTCLKCGMILDLEEAQKEVEKRDKQQKTKNIEMDSLKQQLENQQKMMQEINKTLAMMNKK